MTDDRRQMTVDGIAWRRRNCTLVAALLAAAGTALSAQTGPADAHFAFVRPRFDPSHAMETVTFLDRKSVV